MNNPDQELIERMRTTTPGYVIDTPRGKVYASVIKWLSNENGTPCDHCVFKYVRNRAERQCPYLNACLANKRPDRKPVIYKLVNQLT